MVVQTVRSALTPFLLSAVLLLIAEAYTSPPSFVADTIPTPLVHCFCAQEAAQEGCRTNGGSQAAGFQHRGFMRT